MNKEKLINHCLAFGDAAETYPFKDKTYSDYAVIRHKSNGKWFALIFYLEKKLCVNLKCHPVEASILRDNYNFVTPAWHMNKSHWNTVEVNKAPIDLLDSMIKASFDLTAPKTRKQKSI